MHKCTPPAQKYQITANGKDGGRGEHKHLNQLQHIQAWPLQQSNTDAKYLNHWKIPGLWTLIRSRFFFNRGSSTAHLPPRKHQAVIRNKMKNQQSAENSFLIVFLNVSTLSTAGHESEKCSEIKAFCYWAACSKFQQQKQHTEKSGNFCVIPPTQETSATMAREPQGKQTGGRSSQPFRQRCFLGRWLGDAPGFSEREVPYRRSCKCMETTSAPQNKQKPQLL